MNNQRQWDRHTHDKGLELAFSGGRRFTGRSKDVSLTGLFFLTSDAVHQVTAKEKGTLRLTSGDDTHTFPCQVIRVTNEGLALYIFPDQQAKFGFALSHDIFHNLQTNESKQRGKR